MRKFLYFIPVALLLLLFLLAPFFLKVNLVCKSQYGSCPQKVDAEVLPLGGKSFFEARRMLKNKLKDEKLVSDFSTQFKLPNLLVVNVLVLKPEFAIFVRESQKHYLIGMNGENLGEVDGTNLPTVIQDGQNANIFALSLIKGVSEMYGVSQGEISSDSLLIELPGPIKVILPVEGADSQVTLGALRLVYSKISVGEDAGKYKEIDLRFKNPVLR